MKQLLSFVMLLSALNLLAQNPFEKEILQSKYAIDSIVATEKLLLYKKETAIQQLLTDNRITKEQSTKMLKELNDAVKLSIQQKTYKEGLRLSALIQQKAPEFKIDTLQKTSILDTLMPTEAKESYKETVKLLDSLPETSLKREAKTSINLGLGLGLRAATDGKGNFNPATSVELAFIFNTRVHATKRLYLQYGFSAVGEGLNIKGDKYFTLENDKSTLTPYGRSLDVSRLRTGYFTGIVGVERKFPSKIRIGAGGYFGAIISAKQRIKYKEGDNDYDIWLKHDVKVNPITYGVSAHIGYGIIALYAKYSLAPLFKDSPTNVHPFVIGLKLW
ncbi:hypothetical protein RCZ04_05310 [Capnocytophaga sp. HP1101]